MPGDEKLRELVLYVAERSEGDPAFGAVKLNKLLFYADFAAYLYLGDSITGQDYQKLEHGPAPRRLVPVMAAMEAHNEVAVRDSEYYGRNQRRPFALREPNLDLFTAREIDLVNRILDQFRGMNASRISEDSHRFVGWKLAEQGETIPYEVALVGTREPTEAEREWGRSLGDLAAECLSRDETTQDRP